MPPIAPPASPSILVNRRAGTTCARRSLRRLGAVFTLLALPFAAMPAQPTERSPLSSLSEGARVRITPRPGASRLANDERMIGTVRRVSADSFTYFSRMTGAETLAFSQVALLETSDGRGHYGKYGMGVGFVAGAAVGVAMVLAEPLLSPNFPLALYGAAIVGGVGALAGGLIGVATPRELWRPVALASAGLSVRPLRGDGQWGVGVRLRW